MKRLLARPLLVASLALSACTTEYTSNGQSRQVMTPIGAGIVQTVAAVGIGAGTGALMNKAPGWANGMVSAGAASIGSQVINSFIPQASSSYANSAPRQPYQQQPSYNQDRAYVQPNQPALYYQRPDGSFARAN